MSTRTIAVRLKIPDNEAFTALSALKRLNVTVDRLERADIWVFETNETAAASFAAAVRKNEIMFNPNKHELAELDTAAPRGGEVWIEEIGQDPAQRARLGGKTIPGVLSAKRFVGWRLFDAAGNPVDAVIARTAADVLLCNPAIERALS
ncbi:MAG: hypothetical protein M3N19_10190 [Candidatus Eremiobacteraeota bacterium]|nr:hypothetical protein [Candidatus Eremiobacteraeota bacterium]